MTAYMKYIKIFFLITFYALNLPAIFADDTLEVKYIKELPGSCFGLDFYVIKPMKAAFFMRGNTLWVVFNEKLFVNDKKIARFKSTHIEYVEHVHSDKGTILQIKFKGNEDSTYGLKVIKRDTVWRLVVSPETYFRIKPLIVETKIDGDKKTINFDFKKTGEIIKVEDPKHKDYLYILPTDELGSEVSYTYVQFNILKSQTGFVISSFLKDLAVSGASDGVTIDFKDYPFFISSNKDRTDQRNQSGLDSYFKYIRYTTPPKEDWFTARQNLYRKLAESKGDKNDNERLKLISFFLSTNNYEEAIGHIDALNHIETGGVYFLKGLFYALSGQSNKASSYLYDSRLDFIPETHLWRGFTDSLQGNYKSAFDKMIRNLRYFNYYPPHIKNKLALEAAHAALEIGFSGKLFFNMINPHFLSPYESSYYNFLQGFDFMMNKENKRAKEFLTNSSNSPYRKIQILSKFLLISMETQYGSTNASARNRGPSPQKQELDFLDGLQFEWRYDDLERKVLTRLFKLYADMKMPNQALEKLTTLFEYFPDMDDRNKLADEGEEIFKAECARLLESEPIEGIAFYKRYLNFMPIDDDKIKIYTLLVKALRELNLFHQGAYLFTKILKTLSDQESSYPMVCIEIARFKYDDADFKGALKAINKLERLDILEKDSTSNHDKELLKAKCFIALEQFDDAKNILNDVTSTQAQEILIRIAWRKEEWNKAAELMRDYVKTIGSNSMNITAKFIIEYATALSQAGKLNELGALQDQYGEMMKKSIFAREFELLINPASATLNEEKKT